MLSEREHNEKEAEELLSTKKASLDPVDLSYAALGPSEIRLVEILPGSFDDAIEVIILTVELLQRPVYEALSYVWNPHDGTVNSSQPLAFATVKNWGDFTISLGANLESAIRYLRQGDTSRAIWIDALSINQKALYERNHQVGLMKRVYSSAQEVIIWLGPPHNDSDFAFKTLRIGVLGKLEIPRFINALEFILRRDWFTRVWIAQELTLPQKSPIVHHGHQTLDWDIFSLAIQFVRTIILGEEERLYIRNVSYLETLSKDLIDEFLGKESHLLGDTMYPEAIVARAECVQHLIDLRNAGSSARFTEQLFRTTYLNATDPRDKVFGLLGFSTFEKIDIVPDYTKSIEQVFAEATATVIREDFCSYISAQLWEYLKSNAYLIPSWAANLELMRTLGLGYSSITPDISALKQVLAMNPGKLPIAEFSVDYKRLITVGRHMGRIVETQDISVFLEKIKSSERSIGDVFESHLIPDLHERLLSALLGPSNPHVWDHEDMVTALKRLGTEQSNSTVLAESNLENALSIHGNATVFVTDTKEIGIIRHPLSCPGILIVAGLFGVDIPFVLHEKPGGVYEFLGLAHIGLHTLGDPYMRNALLDTDWKHVPLDRTRKNPSIETHQYERINAPYLLRHILHREDISIRTSSKPLGFHFLDMQVYDSFEY